MQTGLTFSPKANPASPAVNMFLAAFTSRSWVNVYRMVNTALIDSGIVKAKLSPHVLRHTFGTKQIKEGASIQQLQSWMGHDSIATTAIYVHLSEAMYGGRTVL